MILVEIIHFLFTQIPIALETWLSMNVAQRFWTTVGIICGAVALLTGALMLCLNLLINSIILQIQHPLDAYNLLLIGACLVCLIGLAACFALLFIFVWSCLCRWWTALLASAKTVLAVS